MNNEKINVCQKRQLLSTDYNKNNLKDFNNSQEYSKKNIYKNLKNFDFLFKRITCSDFSQKRVRDIPKNNLLSLKKDNNQQKFHIKALTNNSGKDILNDIIPNIKLFLNNEVNPSIKDYDYKNKAYSSNNKNRNQIILPKISRNVFHINNENNNNNFANHNIKSNDMKKSITLEIGIQQKKFHTKLFSPNNNDKKYNCNLASPDKNFLDNKITANKIVNDDNNIENIDTDEKKISMKKSYKLKLFFYSILPGNASYLVQNCMCHRKNWKDSLNKVNSLFNFKWQQLSHGIDYNSLGKNNEIEQIVNHYENHYAISNKANMFINLMQYCEKRKISVFKYVPFTIIFELKNSGKLSEEDQISEFQEKIGALRKFFRISKDFLIDYDQIGNFYQQKEFYTDLKNREKISNYISEFVVYSDHFPKLKEINYVNYANKAKKELREKDKIKNLDKKSIDKNIGENTCIEIPTSHFNGKNMWVIKAINLNRGKCIQIVNNFNQMQAVINKFKNGVDYDFTKEIVEENETKENNKQNTKINNNTKDEKLYNCSKIIIQKYIEKPLLYKGRKCDMRIWVLVNHEMKVYIFKEGHLKTCSVEYDINSKDAFTHITNYSFQKYNDAFEKFEKGNEVPFYEFQKYINETYPDLHYDIKINLMNQIKEIVNLTMRSVAEKINKNGRNYQFEIFGYDFMLDSDFNLFLIEINTNPGLEESSPWIKIIVPRMLDDALRLTIDKIFDPGYDFKYNYNSNQNINQNACIPETEEKDNSVKYISPFPVPGYNLNENLWEFVCDLKKDD